ncbi:MAG: Type 4 prepilin-like protein leader peptide-processing enzyme [Candidatus Roizmanbacteria bacterium GW2011_GWA2_35_19]|uniref:Type 4 prepilin-like protein leader peptide-processing enzyme n=1 Tax=Candidatus Roizmanbacteria bacterium GW2011_GWA2_35_19 TaxID=1618478 RepID=A0A0G0BSH1_9BACT|nr:MAG: Type 4 prepilin-like protein leader peptide-processing enzyme [Candidatus Roizmanbacteria bacterium GW2011_GWA2_35_19]
MTTLFVFVIGIAIGSFLNVLIDRLPKGEAITGRSHCDYCRKKILWYDLIPVFSFLILHGKTRCCNKKLSFQYPLVEIITGISFTFIIVIPNEVRNLATEGGVKLFDYALLDPSGIALRMTMLGIVSCLIIIFFSDLRYHLISDYILLALFIFSLPAVALAKEGPLLSILFNSLASGLIVALPIFLLYYLSRERAMGLGDVYLSAIIGFILGWKSGYIALYIAFVTGAIYGISLLLLKNRKLKSRIAFGPFLVIGLVTMLFWADKIYGLIDMIYKY